MEEHPRQESCAELPEAPILGLVSDSARDLCEEVPVLAESSETKSKVAPSLDTLVDIFDTRIDDFPADSLDLRGESGFTGAQERADFEENIQHNSERKNSVSAKVSIFEQIQSKFESRDELKGHNTEKPLPKDSLSFPSPPLSSLPSDNNRKTSQAERNQETIYRNGLNSAIEAELAESSRVNGPSKWSHESRNSSDGGTDLSNPNEIKSTASETTPEITEHHPNLTGGKLTIENGKIPKKSSVDLSESHAPSAFITSRERNENSLNHRPNLTFDSSPIESEKLSTNLSRELTECQIPSRFTTSLEHRESFPDLTRLEDGLGEVGDNETISFLDKRNFIYRLSLRLSIYRTYQHEVPNADSHGKCDKAGYLLKLSGRGFPYLNQWKRRYCVLSKGCLYLYERDTSKGSEKSSSVLELKYFDQVTEAVHKESKKASNVFVITAHDRSLFDPGRHLFAADTLTEMHEWITKLRDSLELIRNNNRPNTKLPHVDDGVATVTERRLQQQQTNDLLVRSEDAIDSKREVVTGENEEEEESSSFPSRIKELQDQKETRARDEKTGENESGIKKKEEEHPKTKSSSAVITLQPPATTSLSIEAKPQLESITKNRIRGPSGRRAPQSRKTVLMKQRASSMSALQREDQQQHHPEDIEEEGDRRVDRSGSSLGEKGVRNSTLTADGLSRATSNMSFDDIEAALFFKRPSSSNSPFGGEGDGKEEGQSKSRGGGAGGKRRSAFSLRALRFGGDSAEESPDPKKPKKKSASFFRTTTFKFHNFRTSSSSPTSEHPEVTSKASRCTIL